MDLKRITGNYVKGLDKDRLLKVFDYFWENDFPLFSFKTDPYKHQLVNLRKESTILVLSSLPTRP